MNKNLGFYFFSKVKQSAIYAKEFLFAVTPGLDAKNLETPTGQNPCKMKQLWKTQRLNDDRDHYNVFSNTPLL